MAIDVSHDSQLRDIDASFATISSSGHPALRHSIRPELAAMEEFGMSLHVGERVPPLQVPGMAGR